MFGGKGILVCRLWEVKPNTPLGVMILPKGQLTSQWEEGWRVRSVNDSYSDDFLGEWERLTYGGFLKLEGAPPSERLQQDVARLYSRTYQNGQWLTGPKDAAISTGLSISLAGIMGRHWQIAVLAERWLNREGAFAADQLSWINFMGHLGQARIMTARMEEGIAALTALIESHPHRLLPKAEARIRLCHLAELQGPHEPLDEKLLEFTNSLLINWRGCRRLARHVPGLSTFGDLARLLEMTLPRVKLRPGSSMLDYVPRTILTASPGKVKRSQKRHRKRSGKALIHRVEGVSALLHCA